MIRVTPKLCASAAAVLLCVSGSAVAQDEGPTTTYKFGGYAKFDAMFSDYSGPTPDTDELIRQFYVRHHRRIPGQRDAHQFPRRHDDGRWRQHHGVHRDGLFNYLER